MVKKGVALKKHSFVKKPIKANKHLPKKVIHKTSVPKSHISNKDSANKIDRILIENFIALQKVIVNLSSKFDTLGTQMSRLLNLFEKSAEALAKKEFDFSKEEKDHKKILDQIDHLMDQNKTIARSLALMHEVSPEEEQEPNYPPQQIQPPSQQPKPIPQGYSPPPQSPPGLRPPQQSVPGQEAMPHEEYQKSISAQQPLRKPPSEPTTPEFKKFPGEVHA